MPTQSTFKNQAFTFAKKEDNEYDSIKFLGLYKDYEVYQPYCKWWKNNPPKIGLPLLVLINEKEIRWTDGYECFEVMNECKKNPGKK